MGRIENRRIQKRERPARDRGSATGFWFFFLCVNCHWNGVNQLHFTGSPPMLGNRFERQAELSRSSGFCGLRGNFSTRSLKHRTTTPPPPLLSTWEGALSHFTGSSSRRRAFIGTYTKLKKWQVERERKNPPETCNKWCFRCTANKL